MTQTSTAEKIGEANAAVTIAMSQIMAMAQTITDNRDQQNTLMHAEMRLREATMLLGLAEGVPHKLHPAVAALHMAITNADKQARSVMSGDIDMDGMTEEQIDALVKSLTLAEAGYNQFRCLSALVLMHLSSIFTAFDAKKGGE